MLCFSTDRDLRFHISDRIGDLHDHEDSRDEIVNDLATMVQDVANDAGLNWGDDWSGPFDEILGENCWVKTLHEVCQQYRLQTWYIAFPREDVGGWSIVEQFEAVDGNAANKYAEENYSDEEWWVLNSEGRAINCDLNDDEGNPPFSKQSPPPDRPFGMRL
jgi:hypothetical protein